MRENNERELVISRLIDLRKDLNGVAQEVINDALNRVYAGYGDNTIPTSVVKRPEVVDTEVTRPVINRLK